MQVAADIGMVALVALFSAAVLFLLTRLMGYKQMSQMNMFDYITGITIGSIAAELSTELEEVHKPLTAMVVYALVAVGISVATNHSMRLRRWLVGRSVVLYENRKLYRDRLKGAKLDVQDFLAQCRNGGYFDLSELYAVWLEPNGRLSFLPQANKRPATPEDLHTPVARASVQYNVVVDGQEMPEALRRLGRDTLWLQKQLKAQGVTKKEVFLATADEQGTVQVYRMS